MNYFYLSLLCVFLAGMFDATMDARKDYGGATIFARIPAQWFQDWYKGGNEHYSLPIYGPYDFWHSSKSCMMFCWTLALWFLYLAGIEGQPIAFMSDFWFKDEILLVALKVVLIFYWTEALSFILFYHFLWRLF